MSFRALFVLSTVSCIAACGASNDHPRAESAQRPSSTPPAQSAATAPRPAASGAKVSIAWVLARRYLYAARMKSSSTIAAPAQGATFDFELTGKLAITPLEVSANGARLLFAFSEAHFERGQDEAARKRFEGVARELAAPATFSYEDGQLKEARLGKKLEALTVGIMRNVAAAFQFPASPPANTVQSEEYDATGLHRVEYSRGPVPGSFTKKKLDYKTLIMDATVKLAGFGGDAPPPVFKQSSGELSLAEGVPVQFRASEQLEFALMGTNNIDTRTELVLTLSAKEPALPLDLAALSLSTDAILASAPYRGASAAFDFNATKIGGRSFDELIATLELLAAKRASLDLTRARQTAPVPPEKLEESTAWVGQQNRALIALAATLNSQPERIPRALALIRAKSPARSTIISALGAAGTEPAQQALLALMRDRKLSEDRDTAGLALIRTKRPAVSSAHALETLLDDPTWGQHAVLGLGTFTRLFGEDGKLDEYNRIGTLLVRRLSAVKAPTARSDVFAALSNSGYPGMLPAVRPYLDAADPATRESAVEAIRLVRDPEVERVAIQKLKDDAGSVRIAAMLVANNLEPTPALVAALQQTVLGDPSSDVRLRALQLVVGWSEHVPALRATIQQVATSDASESIRDSAQLALQ